MNAINRLRLPLVVGFTALLVANGAGAEDPLATLVRPTDPLSPHEQQQSFRLPLGFEIQLVASEPDILKPINMAFDARGRLWITETTEYPYAVPPDRKGRDNIKVLEDTDGDGRADKIVTFADGLNIPIGIYPYRDGVIAFSIPHIWRFHDTDGDGRADRRDKLYGPMGYQQDTHGLNNAFRRGFDGWLYACHGFSNETTVSGTDGHQIRLHSGNTYRMRLDGTRVEHFTWGQVNPFGMAFDPLFNIFTADCHSLPLSALLRGGYYPSFGKPHDGLGFVAPMMEHLHGSTAISGVAYCTGENFPPAYRGNLFSGNVMTSRVNRNSLQFHGSTISAHEEPDFLTTTDPWFRPVDLVIGPDGALYITDFYNRIIGHYEVPLGHPQRDRHRGRVWRVTYVGDDPQAKPARRPMDLTAAPDEALVQSLDDANLTVSMLAMHELVDRAGPSAVPQLREALARSDSPRVRAHSLWVLQRLGALTGQALERASADSDRAVRVHAMKVLAEIGPWTEAYRQLAVTSLDDSDALVRRAAADALGRHPGPENIVPLLRAVAQCSAEDHHLRHVIRMALRDQLHGPDGFAHVAQWQLSADEHRAIADVCLGIASPQAGSFLLEHLRRFEPDQGTTSGYLQHAARQIASAETAQLVGYVRQRFASDIDVQFSLFESIRAGEQQRGGAPSQPIAEWAEALAKELLDSTEVNSPSLGPMTVARRRQGAAAIAAALALRELEPRLAGLLRQPAADSATRAAAARALVTLNPDVRVAALVAILGQPGIPDQLGLDVERLVLERDASAVDRLLTNAFQVLPAPHQWAMAKALANQASGAETLVELVERGHASPRLLTDETIRQSLTAVLPQAKSRIERLSSAVPPKRQSTDPLIVRHLNLHANAPRSTRQGADVFGRRCAACHQIAGKGFVIGPQLDGIGNRGLARIVEDIIDPSRNVDAAFRTTLVELDTGKVLTGLVRREDGATLVLADHEGKEFSVDTGHITKQSKLHVSLMPENLVDTLSEVEFHDLLAYLLTEHGPPASE